MKEVTHVLDNVIPAKHELELLLNRGYEIITSQLFSPDNNEVFLAAVLVREQVIL